MTNLDKNSIVDDLYYKLYGEHQTKKGQALERLSAVALKILNEERRVQYDKQIQAPYSKTTYQADCLIGDENNQVMVEAKDYTVQNTKVSRADLQKLEGALTDLDISKGLFVSATDYTNRAKPYAERTKTNPKQNPIELYHIRPSNAEDEKERVKTIEVTIIAQGLEFEKGKYIPVINKSYLEHIKNLIPHDNYHTKMEPPQFYDTNGNVSETFENLTNLLYDRLPKDISKGYIMKGVWKFNQPTYMDIPSYGRLQIDALQHEIPS